MVKNILIGLGIAVVIATAIFLYTAPGKQGTIAPSADEEAARAVVTEFGKRLKNVSLLAPTASQDIKEQYGDLISADLLQAWQAEPIKAPGRLTSSPSPERIEILEISPTDDGAYEVQGKVIEGANQHTVALKLRRFESRWLITGFVKALQAQ